MSISIVLADDHAVVLAGYRAVLVAEPDLSVVGQVTAGAAVVDEVERLHPDVLVLDLLFPDMHGLDIVRELHLRTPSVKVIIASMHDSPGYVFQALNNGAHGYVLKQGPARDLLRAIRAVAQGSRFLSEPLSEANLEAYREVAQSMDLELYETLSGREREVMRLVAQGLTSAQIAHDLEIGRRTVETYRTNVMRKMKFTSHSALLRYAIKLGIIASTSTQ